MYQGKEDVQRRNASMIQACQPNQKATYFSNQSLLLWPIKEAPNSTSLLLALNLKESNAPFAVCTVPSPYHCLLFMWTSLVLWMRAKNLDALVQTDNPGHRTAQSVMQCSWQKHHFSGSYQWQWKHFFYYIQHALRSSKLVLTSSIFYLILRAFLPAHSLPFLQNCCWLRWT